MHRLQLQHRLTIQEYPSILGTATQFAEQGSFSLYDEPCAIRLKGDLEAIICEFPCKQLPVPCNPLYIKTDELLVSEEALGLWKAFRELLGEVKLRYLPSQLTELIRYNSDFDRGDEHFDYGDEAIARIDASLREKEPVFEAILFSLTDEAQEDEGSVRFTRSLIAQRRRSESHRPHIPAFAGGEIYTNGAFAYP